MNPSVVLHDIILPDAPGWWPLSFLSWTSIILLCLALGLVTWQLRRLWRRRRQRQKIHKLWQEQLAAVSSDTNPCGPAHSFLKRLLAQKLSPSVLKLDDSSWCDLVRQEVPPNEQKRLTELLESRYRPQTRLNRNELDQLIQACIRSWL